MRLYEARTSFGIMHRHFAVLSSYFLSHHLMNSPFDSSGSAQTPVWTGFLVGLLAGFAVSSLLIGLVLGAALSGGIGSVTRGTPTVANQPPTAPTPPPAPDTPSKPPAPVTARDHVLGNPNAKVTVIEYSDFECPFCKRHAPTMAQIHTLYKDDVNIVYRHFPLSFHQNAMKEAEASECVAELAGNDAFWKFHDAIFDRTAAGGTGFALDKLPALAKEVGANEAKFKQCLDSGKYTKYVQDQLQEGIDAGVQGTPGNFVVNNDTKESKDISGAVPVTTFQSAIDAMLKKS